MVLSKAKLLDSDYTVPVNTTVFDGVDFISKEVVLAYAREASLTLYVKGNNAGCSNAVVFCFSAYNAALNKWDTLELFSQNIPASGTSEVLKTIILDASFERIKLLSVQNQETTVGYTIDVNVGVFIREK